MKGKIKVSKNSKELVSFTNYCLKNPEQRFWQALRNWAGVPFIYKSDGLIRDTFHEE